MVAGRSTTSICGVRDYGAVLAQALRERGWKIRLRWEESADPRLRAGTRLLQGVLAEIGDAEASVLVLNYSVFAFSYKGVPLGVPALARRLRNCGLPVVLVAHELAYPWGRRGLVGLIHAIAQRMALVPLVRACSALVVTTEERAEWLRSRWWLMRRPVTVAPVCSNLPTGARFPPPAAGNRVAMFGYDRDRRIIGLVCAAVSRCRSDPAPTVVLVGGPGAQSTCAARWREGAKRHGCTLEFTGVLAPEALAEVLARSEVVLFADRQGPTSRRGTLAAALALGCCVLAVAGPDTWSDLVEAGAVVAVEARPAALAGRLEQLLADPVLRASVGQRGAAFYATRMSPEVVGAAIDRAVGDVTRAPDVLASWASHPPTDEQRRGCRRSDHPTRRCWARYLPLSSNRRFE